MELVFERPKLVGGLLTFVGCGCRGRLAFVSKAFQAAWQSSSLSDATIGVLLVVDPLAVDAGFCIDDGNFWGNWKSPIVLYDLRTGKFGHIGAAWQRRRNYAAVFVGDSVYIFGGYTDEMFEFSDIAEAHNDVWKYDLDTNMWTEQPPMPTARAAAAAVKFDGCVFVLGGCQRSVDEQDVEFDEELGDLVGTSEWSNEETALATVEKFSPETDDWDQVPSMLTPRLNSTAVAVKNSIIVFGGKGGSSLLEDMECLDVDTFQWSSCSIKIGPRRLSAALGLAGSIYVFGGDVHSTCNLSTLKITLDTENVTCLPEMPTPAHFSSALLIDDSIYVFGSNDSSDSERTAAVCKLDLQQELWSQLPSMHIRIGRCCAAHQVFLRLVKDRGEPPAQEASDEIHEPMPVIQSVEHTEAAAEIHTEEAKEIVAEQYAGGIQSLLSTGIAPTEDFVEDEEEQKERILICMLNRRPKGIAEAFQFTMKPQIEAMEAEGYDWKLLEGSLIFVHPHQYISTKHALIGHVLHPSNVIFSESLEYLVAEALDSIGKGAWAKTSKVLGVVPGPHAEMDDSILVGSSSVDAPAENDAAADGDDQADDKTGHLKKDTPNAQPLDSLFGTSGGVEAKVGFENDADFAKTVKEHDWDSHPVCIVSRTFLTYAKAPRVATSVVQSTTDADSSKGLNPRRKRSGGLGQ